ncbi:MAG: hypothetical protein EZS28_009057, partial [Streblomastix strix]
MRMRVFNVLQERVPLNMLNIQQIRFIIVHGLLDREKEVQNAFQKMICEGWLLQCRGDSASLIDKLALCAAEMRARRYIERERRGAEREMRHWRRISLRLQQKLYGQNKKSNQNEVRLSIKIAEEENEEREDEWSLDSELCCSEQEDEHIDLQTKKKKEEKDKGRGYINNIAFNNDFIIIKTEEGQGVKRLRIDSQSSERNKNQRKKNTNKQFDDDSSFFSSSSSPSEQDSDNDNRIISIERQTKLKKKNEQKQMKIAILYSKMMIKEAQLRIKRVNAVLMMIETTGRVSRQIEIAFFEARIQDIAFMVAKYLIAHGLTITLALKGGIRPTIGNVLMWQALQAALIMSLKQEYEEESIAETAERAEKEEREREREREWAKEEEENAKIEKQHLAELQVNTDNPNDNTNIMEKDKEKESEKDKDTQKEKDKEKLIKKDDQPKSKNEDQLKKEELQRKAERKLQRKKEIDELKVKQKEFELKWVGKDWLWRHKGVKQRLLGNKDVLSKTSSSSSSSSSSSNTPSIITANLQNTTLQGQAQTTEQRQRALSVGNVTFANTAHAPFTRTSGAGILFDRTRNEMEKDQNNQDEERRNEIPQLLGIQQQSSSSSVLSPSLSLSAVQQQRQQLPGQIIHNEPPNANTPTFHTTSSSSSSSSSNASSVQQSTGINILSPKTAGHQSSASSGSAFTAVVPQSTSRSPGMQHFQSSNITPNMGIQQVTPNVGMIGNRDKIVIDLKNDIDVQIEIEKQIEIERQKELEIKKEQEMEQKLKQEQQDGNENQNQNLNQNNNGEDIDSDLHTSSGPLHLISSTSSYLTSAKGNSAQYILSEHEIQMKRKKLLRRGEDPRQNALRALRLEPVEVGMLIKSVTDIQRRWDEQNQEREEKGVNVGVNIDNSIMTQIYKREALKRKEKKQMNQSENNKNNNKKKNAGIMDMDDDDDDDEKEEYQQKVDKQNRSGNTPYMNRQNNISVSISNLTNSNLSQSSNGYSMLEEIKINRTKVRNLKRNRIFQMIQITETQLKQEKDKDGAKKKKKNDKENEKVLQMSDQISQLKHQYNQKIKLPFTSAVEWLSRATLESLLAPFQLQTLLKSVLMTDIRRNRVDLGIVSRTIITSMQHLQYHSSSLAPASRIVAFVEQSEDSFVRVMLKLMGHTIERGIRLKQREKALQTARKTRALINANQNQQQSSADNDNDQDNQSEDEEEEDDISAPPSRLTSPSFLAPAPQQQQQQQQQNPLSFFQSPQFSGIPTPQIQFSPSTSFSFTPAFQTVNRNQNINIIGQPDAIAAALDAAQQAADFGRKKKMDEDDYEEADQDSILQTQQLFVPFTINIIPRIRVIPFVRALSLAESVIVTYGMHLQAPSIQSLLDQFIIPASDSSLLPVRSFSYRITRLISSLSKNVCKSTATRTVLAALTDHPSVSVSAISAVLSGMRQYGVKEYIQFVNEGELESQWIAGNGRRLQLMRRISPTAAKMILEKYQKELFKRKAAEEARQKAAEKAAAQAARAAEGDIRSMAKQMLADYQSQSGIDRSLSQIIPQKQALPQESGDKNKQQQQMQSEDENERGHHLEFSLLPTTSILKLSEYTKFIETNFGLVPTWIVELSRWPQMNNLRSGKVYSGGIITQFTEEMIENDINDKKSKKESSLKQQTVSLPPTLFYSDQQTSPQPSPAESINASAASTLCLITPSSFFQLPLILRPLILLLIPSRSFSDAWQILEEERKKEIEKIDQFLKNKISDVEQEDDQELKNYGEIIGDEDEDEFEIQNGIKDERIKMEEWLEGKNEETSVLDFEIPQKGKIIDDEQIINENEDIQKWKKSWKRGIYSEIPDKDKRNNQYSKIPLSIQTTWNHPSFSLRAAKRRFLAERVVAARVAEGISGLLVDSMLPFSYPKRRAKKNQNQKEKEKEKENNRMFSFERRGREYDDRDRDQQKKDFELTLGLNGYVSILAQLSICVFHPCESVSLKRKQLIRSALAIVIKRLTLHSYEESKEEYKERNKKQKEMFDDGKEDNDKNSIKSVKFGINNPPSGDYSVPSEKKHRKSLSNSFANPQNSNEIHLEFSYDKLNQITKSQISVLWREDSGQAAIELLSLLLRGTVFAPVGSRMEGFDIGSAVQFILFFTQEVDKEKEKSKDGTAEENSNLLDSLITKQKQMLNTPPNIHERILHRLLLDARSGCLKLSDYVQLSSQNAANSSHSGLKLEQGGSGSRELRQRKPVLYSRWSTIGFNMDKDNKNESDNDDNDQVYQKDKKDEEDNKLDWEMIEKLEKQREEELMAAKMEEVEDNVLNSENKLKEQEEQQQKDTPSKLKAKKKIEINLAAEEEDEEDEQHLEAGAGKREIFGCRKLVSILIASLDSIKLGNLKRFSKWIIDERKIEKEKILKKEMEKEKEKQVEKEKQEQKGKKNKKIAKMEKDQEQNKNEKDKEEIDLQKELERLQINNEFILTDSILFFSEIVLLIASLRMRLIEALESGLIKYASFELPPPANSSALFQKAHQYSSAATTKLKSAVQQSNTQIRNQLNNLDEWLYRNGMNELFDDENEDVEQKQEQEPETEDNENEKKEKESQDSDVDIKSKNQKKKVKVKDKEMIKDKDNIKGNKEKKKKRKKQSIKPTKKKSGQKRQIIKDDSDGNSKTDEILIDSSNDDEDIEEQTLKQQDKKKKIKEQEKEREIEKLKEIEQEGNKPPTYPYILAQLLYLTSPPISQSSSSSLSSKANIYKYKQINPMSLVRNILIGDGIQLLGIINKNYHKQIQESKDMNKQPETPKQSKQQQQQSLLLSSPYTSTSIQSSPGFNSLSLLNQQQQSSTSSIQQSQSPQLNSLNSFITLITTVGKHITKSQNSLRNWAAEMEEFIWHSEDQSAIQEEKEERMSGTGVVENDYDLLRKKLGKDNRRQRRKTQEEEEIDRDIKNISDSLNDINSPNIKRGQRIKKENQDNVLNQKDKNKVENKVQLNLKEKVSRIDKESKLVKEKGMIVNNSQKESAPTWKKVLFLPPSPPNSNQNEEKEIKKKKKQTKDKGIQDSIIEGKGVK